MLKFSMAFDTLEKAITVLEYKASTKIEEDNKDNWLKIWYFYNKYLFKMYKMYIF